LATGLVATVAKVFAHPAVSVGLFGEVLVGPDAIRGAAPGDVVVTFGDQPGHTIGQVLAIGLGSDLVDGLGPVVAAGDGADKSGGVVAVAAASLAYTGGRVGVFVVAFPSDAVVDIGAVEVAAAGESDVEGVAVGGVAHDRVGGVGGDALGGLQGDGVAVVDVLAQVVAGEHGHSVVAEAAGHDGRALFASVDGLDDPALPVADLGGGLAGVEMAAVISCGPHVDTSIVFAGHDDVAHPDLVITCPGDGLGVIADAVGVDLFVERVAQFPTVGD
jgi:hypothetical protein